METTIRNLNGLMEETEAKITKYKDNARRLAQELEQLTRSR